jgi:hypothetical protein
MLTRRLLLRVLRKAFWWCWHGLAGCKTWIKWHNSGIVPAGAWGGDLFFGTCRRCGRKQEYLMH